MQTRDFCYWLQGYFELVGDTSQLSIDQIECIKRHLNMVFVHDIDPKFGKDLPKLKEAHQVSVFGATQPDCYRCQGTGKIESNNLGNFLCGICNGTGKQPNTIANC